MTCKIERVAAGEGKITLRVCGQVQLEHTKTVKDLIARESGSVLLDLAEVTLVDRDVIPLLAACEANGHELRNCPAYLREWISKEQKRISDESRP